ncbi:bem46 protein [Paramecium bursaria]
MDNFIIRNKDQIAAIAVGGLSVTLAGAFMINMAQEKFIYHPDYLGNKLSKFNPAGYQHPKERNIDCQDVQLKSDVELKGWFLKQQDFETKPTVIFCHENAGNLGHRLEYLESYYKYVGCNILAVAYRGYDESLGSPSQVGIEQDILAIYRYATTNLKIKESNIFLHGRSLGGAVAIYLATQRNPQGILIENTFTSIPDVIKTIVPIKFIPLLFRRNQWPSIQRISQVKAKQLLFISSGKDELVPYEQMLKLIQNANPEITEQYHIPNGTHNENWQVNEQEYFQKIKNFIFK